MNRPPVRLGPLALLLSVISICLAILAILTVSTARADLRLAEKTADTVKLRYALEEQGQRLLRELEEADGRHPSGWEPAEDGSLSRTLEDEGARLHITVRPSSDGHWTVTEWVHDREWVPDLSIGNLWNGF